LRKGALCRGLKQNKEQIKSMATYHLTAKIGKKGMGRAHAAYIAREGKYSEGKRYEDLEANGSGNMPAWAEHNPAYFWQAADEKERANGSAYREIEIALPREFTPAQRLELVQEFINQELAEKHAYQFAIHIPKAALENGEQPHAHIMYSERIRDGIERDPEQYFKRYNSKNPEKGGHKKFSGGKSPEELKAELLALREKWAELQNKHLEKNGHDTRVDHRSLKEQGIDREAEKHLGGLGVRNTNQADKKNLLELRAANAEHEQAKAEVINILDYKNRLSATPEQQKEIRETAALEMEKFKKERADKAEALAIQQMQERLNKEKELRESLRKLELEKLKPTPEQQEQRAKQTLIDFDRQLREKWRKKEHEILLNEANKLRENHKELNAKEPKSFFGGAKWRREHEAWVDGTNRIRQELIDTLEAAKNALEGKSAKERGLQAQFEQVALESLKKHYPELFQVLIEKQQKADLEAKAAERERRQRMDIEKTVSDFKSLAVKRESKSFGFRDDGKKWNALPSELKIKIETYNEQSPAKRSAILNEMKDQLTQPKALEKLTKQLEQGKEQDIGMSL